MTRISPWDSIVIHLRMVWVLCSPMCFQMELKTHSLCLQNIDTGWERLCTVGKGSSFSDLWRKLVIPLWKTIHSGYRSQTSIENSRYKERIISTCCCTIQETGYHTYCVPIWPQIQIYQSTLKYRWIFKATIARTSHTLVESKQKWFRITEYEIV